MDDISKRRVRANIAIGVAMALGAGGLFERTGLRQGSKTHCVACQVEIPPGRAGRKCEECRKNDNKENQSPKSI